MCNRSIAILNELKALGDPDFVFPGQRQGKSLSGGAMASMLKRMGEPGTTHGMRATFKTWCRECTNVPDEVSEIALAHMVDNKVAAAYVRGDALERRRELMNRWSAFCNPSSVENVIRLRSSS